MRRKPLPPDTRLDWRDPDMLVCREYITGAGRKIGPFVDPDFERRFREYKLQITEHEPSIPSWRDDPTYNPKGRSQPSSQKPLEPPEITALIAPLDELLAKLKRNS